MATTDLRTKLCRINYSDRNFLWENKNLYGRVRSFFFHVRLLLSFFKKHLVVWWTLLLFLCKCRCGRHCDVGGTESTFLFILFFLLRKHRLKAWAIVFSFFVLATTVANLVFCSFRSLSSQLCTNCSTKARTAKTCSMSANSGVAFQFPNDLFFAWQHTWISFWAKGGWRWRWRWWLIRWRSFRVDLIVVIMHRYCGRCHFCRKVGVMVDCCLLLDEVYR